MKKEFFKRKKFNCLSKIQKLNIFLKKKKKNWKKKRSGAVGLNPTAEAQAAAEAAVG